MAESCLSCSRVVPEGKVLFCTEKRVCVRPGAVCSRYENFKNKMAEKLGKSKEVFPLENLPSIFPLFTPVQTSENLHSTEHRGGSSTPEVTLYQGGEDDSARP